MDRIRTDPDHAAQANGQEVKGKERKQKALHKWIEEIFAFTSYYVDIETEYTGK